MVGTAVHLQRGEWLISHVHIVLGHPQEALRHAERCFQLTESHRALMEDFDLTYSYEGLARANALSGNLTEGKDFYHQARQTAENIGDEEDKSIFLGDFQSGDWFGLLD